uniref:PAP-associated domain-containing protein n=1 Tax=Steinernema glaseri TaxID=37863 RepID=A0A1I7ZR24_9BILA
MANSPKSPPLDPFERVMVTHVGAEITNRIFARIANYKNHHPVEMNALDRTITQHFNNIIAPRHEFELKERIRQRLIECAKKVFQFGTLVTVGSTAQLLCERGGDLDLCLCVADDKGDFTQDIVERRELLEDFHAWLTVNRPVDMLCFSRYIQATVPIVRLALNEDYNDMDVDITCNAVKVFYTNHLIQHYIMLDKRVQKLIMAVKSWARRNGVLDSQHGKLNSFTLTMMVIHYMQCVVSPPILPNLTELFPSVFLPEKVPLDNLPLVHGFCIPQNLNMAENDLTLGELFLGFIMYYAEYEWGRYAIYVRLGKRVQRETQLESERDTGEMYIEEPFEHYNTMRTMRNPFVRKDIQDQFQAIVDGLREEKLDLAGLI